ncbi:MAG TPA: Fur family transcriptional regulator [Thermodesulfovibrionales bacterium]|nr:Fur family transcriptional regulator [Thermodesulfovibrionales bacterium]
MKVYGQIGFKLTPQRIAILDYLNGNKEHPSADEIYRAVSEKFPTMSFATVYNTLDALKRRGMLLEITIDPHKKRFDPDSDPHHHLMCMQCMKVVDVHNKFELTIPLSQRHGFEITGNHIEFHGLCKQCRETPDEKNPQTFRGDH